MVGEFLGINQRGLGKCHFMELDTGSDRVILCRSFCKEAGLIIRKFENPRKVVGVSGAQIICNEYTIFTLKLYAMNGSTVVMNLIAYVFELGSVPCLLGNDVFKEVRAVIDYENNTVRMDGELIELFNDKREAREWCRERNKEEEVRLVNFCCKGEVEIQPRELKRVVVEVGKGADLSRVHHLIGNDFDDMIILNVTYTERVEEYVCLVKNKSDKRICIKAGAQLGQVWGDGMLENKTRIESFVIQGIEEDKVLRVEAVNIMDLPTRRRLSPKTFDEVLDHGVGLNPGVTVTMTENYVFPEPDINEGIERERNREIKFWEKDKLFEALALDEMEEEMKEELGVEGAKELRGRVEAEAWAFRGIFFTGNWEEYKEPLRIPPIKLQTIENMPSVICKYRKISPEKTKILKEMVEKMVRGGIIGKSDGRGRCVSNPHVILEEKVENGITSIRPRVTQDFRAVNECLLSESYKLKNIDAVLQKVTNEGRIFSVCDATKWFWQLPLHEDSRFLTNFYVADDVYLFFRCAMGMKPIPQVAQRVTDHIVDTIKEAAVGFIDDFCIYGLCYNSAFGYLKRYLIIASHFNVKLMPQKCKWLRKTQIFLGYRIAFKKLFRIIPSNVKKLRNLQSPNSKKELRSFLGLLAWFQNRTNIREKSYRLRQLAKANARFKWDNEHEQDLRDCIEIILDPISGCLRPAVEASEECKMCVMTDASKTSLGAVLVQYQYITEEEAHRENIDKSTRRLYLIEYYSSFIHERDMILPIAILELYSLEKALAHWRHYLYGSYKFIVLTDSAYVSFWVNLRIISERVARSIYFIGTYDFNIHFIPSTLNASDVFSRADLNDGETQPIGAKSKNIFKNINIYNSEGEVIPHVKIFSRQKQELMDEYFMNRTKGKLVEALNLREVMNDLEESEGCVDKSEALSLAKKRDSKSRGQLRVSMPGALNLVSHSPGVLGEMETSACGASPEPTGAIRACRVGVTPDVVPEVSNRGQNKCGRSAARRRRNLLKKTKDVGVKMNATCEICECVGLGDTDDYHCTCCCVEMKEVAQEIDCYRVSTDDQLDGHVEMRVTNDLRPYVLPDLQTDRLEQIKRMQCEDDVVIQCKDWVEKTKQLPNKTESLGLSAELLSVLRHIDLFKVNGQGIVFRLFVDSDGGIQVLIFLNGKSMNDLIRETHESYGHMGVNKVMNMIKRNYYTTGLRHKCSEVIKNCVTCIKYNPIRTVKEKWSTHMSSNPREMWTLDLAGPLPMSGSYKYIAVIRDNFSRESFLRPCRSTSGDEVAKVLLSVFEEEGFPETLVVDGGCLTKSKIDREILSKLNVKIRISNNQSRAQSPAERLIQEVIKRMLKLLDDKDSLQGWHKLLRKIQFDLNITPSSVGNVSPFQLTRRHAVRSLVPNIEPIRLANSTANDFNALVKMYESVRMSAMLNLISHKSYTYPCQSLTEGRVVFRKRMSFARNMNRKLQIKVLTGYRVLERVGSGLYKLKNLMSDEVVILPVDQLVLTNLNKVQVKEILSKIGM